MHRLHPLGVLVGLLILSLGCGGSSPLDNSGVPIFITTEIRGHNPEVNLCAVGGPNGGADLTILTMILTSNPVNASQTLTSNQDANLTDWLVSPRRVDAGTVVSPEWSTEVGVFVSAGGSTTLENYRIYPVEFLSESPFIYLLPENGGVDAETGEAYIRESMRVVLSGRTVSGKSVSTQATLVDYRFFCN